MKKINANTPWGQYQIPAETVAHNRATHYATDDLSYDEEYWFTFDDNYELIDWLLNNMDWEDVSEKAVKFSDKVLVLEDDFWSDSDDFWIVDESV